MSAGGGKSSSSNSSIDRGTDVWGPQQGYLKDIYSQAQALKGQVQDTVGNWGVNQAQSYLGNLMGANQTAQDLQNPGVNPAMDMYSRQIGQQFNEQIMPALKGQAMTAGGYGGSRAGIAQGLAGARAGQQIQDFGAQLYNEDQNRRLQGAQLQGDLANLGMQGAMDIGSFGMGVPWYNLQQYAGLIGSPAMQSLGGSSKGKSSSWNVSGGLW